MLAWAPSRVQASADRLQIAASVAAQLLQFGSSVPGAWAVPARQLPALAGKG